MSGFADSIVVVSDAVSDFASSLQEENINTLAVKIERRIVFFILCFGLLINKKRLL